MTAFRPLTKKLALPLVSALALGTAAPAVAQDDGSEEMVSWQVETTSGTIQVEKLASLEFPWGMEYLPSGAMLITEKPDALYTFMDGELSEPIAGVPEVAYKNQGGLLDVAVDPDFTDNQYIYLYHVVAADVQPEGLEVDADPRLGPYVDESDTVLKRGQVARARLVDGALEDVEIIWSQSQNVVGLGHFGGRLTFAPDGKLLITSGERQSFTPAQDRESNLGKIIRINSDGTIPEDNPFAGEDAPLNAVWSMGHRNPLGADIHPETEEYWIHEMGALHGDELNKPQAEANYGWPEVSNGEHYNRVEIPHHETALDEYERPAYYWRPAISPSGLEFYDGKMFADWSGNALVGSLSAQTLVRLELDGDNVAREHRIPLNLRVRDVTTALDGSVYVLTDYQDGALLRLTPAMADDTAAEQGSDD